MASHARVVLAAPELRRGNRHFELSLVFRVEIQLSEIMRAGKS